MISSDTGGAIGPSCFRDPRPSWSRNRAQRRVTACSRAPRGCSISACGVSPTSASARLWWYNRVFMPLGLTVPEEAGFRRRPHRTTDDVDEILMICRKVLAPGAVCQRILTAGSLPLSGPPVASELTKNSADPSSRRCAKFRHVIATPRVQRGLPLSGTLRAPALLQPSDRACRGARGRALQRRVPIRGQAPGRCAQHASAAAAGAVGRRRDSARAGGRRQRSVARSPAGHRPTPSSPSAATYASSCSIICRATARATSSSNFPARSPDASRRRRMPRGSSRAR